MTEGADVTDFPLIKNLVASVPQDTDYLYEPTKPIVWYEANGNPHPVDPLPDFAPFIDLKLDVFEVDDQLQVPSCTANAGTSALEVPLKRVGEGRSLSRLFPFWTAKNYIDTIQGDGGTSVRSMVRAFKHYGVCYETTWPYDVTKVNEKPSDAAFAEAALHKVQRYEILKPIYLVWWTQQQKRDNLLLKIKSALNEGLAVFFSCRINQKWMEQAGLWQDSNYVFPDPDFPTNGAHAMDIIGYDDARKIFLLENSWGPAWGDGGFGGMPYEALLNSFMEAFIIRGFDGLYVNDPLQEQFDWIQKMYLGFYGRSADFEGMAYWRNRLIKEGFGNIVEAFMTSPEAAGLYTEARMQDANRITRKG